VAVLAVVAAAFTGCRPVLVERTIGVLSGPLASTSVLLGCDQAAQKLVITTTSHLDPSCTYTGGVEIATSHVTLDCRGARIEDPTGAGRRGILISAANDVALTDVTVRNCVVKGFLNTVRVSKPDFRSLPAGDEYRHPFSDIVLENLRLYSSRGSGIFVDAFVTGVTIRAVEVAGAGSVGIYLEAGSKDNVIEHSTIHSNGYADVKPEGVPFSFGGEPYRYRSTGREGIAVDGSRNNVIRHNRISWNSAGGIFLYRNCGEYATEKPDSWWHRPYGSTGNLIEHNTIHHQDDGVWIASRQAENQLFMDCSDTPMTTGAFRRNYHDPATDNVIRANTFEHVARGVRVEDDRNRVEDNEFTGADPAAVAVLIGTKHRTLSLGQPVDATVVAGNRAALGGNATPYRWIHGQTNTTFSANLADSVPAGLVPGTQPTIDPFLFVMAFWPEGSPPPP
jgi:parallel beta-helix repeat protein